MPKLNGIVLGGHIVSFKRYEEELPMPGQEEEKNPQMRISQKTKCIIHNSKGEILTKSVVAKHHDEQNNKVLGRHYAFKKAMQDLNATKEIKTEIWNDYRRRLKNPTPSLQSN